MSNTPSRRLSLRRKRGTKEAQDTGSPASKKSSPSLDTASDGEAEHSLSSHIFTSRRTRSQSSTLHSQSQPPPPLTSPQHFLQSPKRKGYQHGSHATPRTNHQQESPGESLQQHSPDMPFLSSQLCSTQECEVVWNCDSPGFSKDDLKRMHGGKTGSDAGGCSLSPLGKSQLVTHRALFSWTRSKPMSTATADIKKTTSQLNQLLDQLCKHKDEEMKMPDNIKLELPEFHNEDLSSTQNSTLSASPPLPKLLKAPSSQPFTVPVVEEPSSEKYGNTTAVEEDALDMCESVDDSVWADELNIGICDISGINLVSDETITTLGKKSDCYVNNVNKLEPTGTAVGITCESGDVFDDDLFNESVIKSTQAVEEALGEVNEPQHHIKSGGSSGCMTNDRLGKNTFMPHTSARIDELNYLPKSTKEPTTSCKSDCKLKGDTFSSECGSSLILGKNQTSSNKLPQRQVRNSFQLGLNVPSQQKENMLSVQSCQETNHGRCVNNTECSMKNNIKINLVVPKQQVQSVKMTAKPSYSVCIGTKINSQASQCMEAGSSRKALTRKGPILRSQSAGDAKVNDTVNSVRRSNSFVEKNTTQEFEEDDEIFKSLLSVLPEDDALLEGQILQPQVFMASHKSADVKQNTKHLESSTSVNLSQYQTVGTEKKVTSLVAQRDLLGAVGKEAAKKSSSPEYTGVIRDKRTQNQECENGDVLSNWISHSKSGMKEGSGKQACASSTSNLGHTSAHLQTSDMLDDDLFEDDVLTLIDEVETQYGSQQPYNGPSSSQLPQSQLVQCTQDEIARKKEAARRLREDRKQQRHCSSQYHPV